ncbi:MAG: hypothetical protein LBU39_03070 [Desulfobulbaceae bacterium]|jgi:hypothetical protein|nr:hypothetical protein [Desulfobulbaceae bacterium]
MIVSKFYPAAATRSQTVTIHLPGELVGKDVVVLILPLENEAVQSSLPSGEAGKRVYVNSPTWSLFHHGLAIKKADATTFRRHCQDTVAATIVLDGETFQAKILDTGAIIQLRWAATDQIAQKFREIFQRSFGLMKEERRGGVRRAQAALGDTLTLICGDTCGVFTAVYSLAVAPPPQKI